MTRIIAGFAKSRPLIVPRSGTRPTSDQVREAIFSIITANTDLTGVTVFDLYAGSGALGLEAISRGAHRAILVEQAKSATETCRRNAALVLKDAPDEASITVIKSSVSSFLNQTILQADLVFIDPPYDHDEHQIANEITQLPARLTLGATVIIERSTRSPQPQLPPKLLFENNRNYGGTRIWWAKNTNLERYPSP